MQTKEGKKLQKHWISWEWKELFRQSQAFFIIFEMFSFGKI